MDQKLVQSLLSMLEKELPADDDNDAAGGTHLFYRLSRLYCYCSLSLVLVLAYAICLSLILKTNPVCGCCL
jgi:hypothetical protein